MKTLVAFCQKTGRLVSRWLNRLARTLTHKGQLRIRVAVSIPFIAKFEVGYVLTLEKSQDEAA